MEACEPPDPFSEMENYLREWGLQDYIPRFKEQLIDLETLQMLSESDIKELIPVIGHRARLCAQIKLLKSITTNFIQENKTEEKAHCSKMYVLQPLDTESFDAENIQENIEEFRPPSNPDVPDIPDAPD